ncbi:hypothetical protein [Psychroflexus salis]|uniref:Uncharacterized protein n=1 Tax=Psychroflexus salis TaxID=1526574 RepID=A0A917A132_9FLAO|nr:hypothetical protein [Psychroflexus salis]GGE21628.1 hypothetical protein GCM10010831_23380 [Psychroflexus salis]
MDKDKVKILANRNFYKKNFIGSKTTWTFNENGSKLNIKTKWFGINTANSIINVSSLGDGSFVGKGFMLQKFYLEDNTIKSGTMYLKEVSE